MYKVNISFLEEWIQLICIQRITQYQYNHSNTYKIPAGEY